MTRTLFGVRFSLFVFTVLVATGSILAQEGAKPAQPAPATPAAAAAAPAPANLPLWAYGYAQPGSTPAPAMPPAQDDGSPKTLAGSTGNFRSRQVRDARTGGWHPAITPRCRIVASGSRTGTFARARLGTIQRKGARGEPPVYGCRFRTFGSRWPLSGRRGRARSE